VAVGTGITYVDSALKGKQKQAGEAEAEAHSKKQLLLKMSRHTSSQQSGVPGADQRPGLPTEASLNQYVC